MIQVDIDGLVPETIIRSIAAEKTNRRMGLPTHASWVKGYGSNFHRRLGFDPKKLIDWRALERRSFQLGERQKVQSKEFWDLLKAYHEQATTMGLGHVWILNPIDNTHSYRFDGESLGSFDVVREIEAHIKKMQEPHRHAFVISGDEAARFFHLNDRKRQSGERFFTYQRAFRYAVESRVEAFVHGKLDRSNRRYRFFNPGVVAIVNDDRTHLLEVDTNGILKWLEGELFVLK